jgi:signal transduction histidine kinase
VIPITRDSDEGIPGALLVLGINAALPFDSTYATFIDLLRLQLASFLVAVRSYVQDQELIQQLAEVDHAKNLLFANVANDLLAPISLIAGPLDDLVDDVEASPTGAVLLNIARRNVRSLRAMVRMLVEVSALSRGAGVMTFTRVNLGALSRDMASMFRRGIEKQGVEYKIDCDLTPHEVYVDREAWEKVVVTTIGMSAKYTRCG